MTSQSGPLRAGAVVEVNGRGYRVARVRTEFDGAWADLEHDGLELPLPLDPETGTPRRPERT